MESENMLLMAKLPGLEAAKQAIEDQIEAIHKVLTKGMATYERPPLALDPDLLGRDVLGRIKRKRKISPELRAAKIKLIGEARQTRLDNIAKEKAAEKKKERLPIGPGEVSRG